MSKKRGLADLIGERIVAVTVKESDQAPEVQLFLTLEDGRYFEVWSRGPGMGFGSMAYDGGLADVRSQGREGTRIVFEVVADEEGNPQQTVAAEARDLIERRKSQQSSD